MPDLPDMLKELYEMVRDGEIYQDDCTHRNEAIPDVSGGDFCRVCFITNLYLNCSEREEEMIDETTDAQRETIESLWEEFC